MQREALIEFRTGQHPSLESNNWGDASPLLARRNVSEESYVRLDEVLPPAAAAEVDVDEDVDDHRQHTPRCFGRIRWWFFLKRKRKMKVIVLGNRRRWRLPRLDPENKWPNGWC